MKATPLGFLASACLVFSAAAEIVPGGDFQLYKPGSTSVTATLASGYVPWPSSIPNPTAPTSLTVNLGSANYSDNTTGTTVDLLGWTNPQGGGDILNNGPGGSVALNLFAAWGGFPRAIIETTGSLHTIGAGDAITISTMVGGPSTGPKAGSFFFSLYAGGVEVTPTSAINQVLPLNEGFQMISRTYDAAALAAFSGQPAKIRIAIPDSNTIANRIIFDDVSILVVPGPAAPFQFVITPNATAGLFDFEWTSQSGKLYDLLTSTDLATPISSWPVYDDGTILYENLPATGTTTTVTGVPSPDPRRFFALREEDAPPVPPLLSENFDTDDGGFTITKVAGTDWVWGDPDSTGPGGTISTGNGGAGSCWGTNIGNPGFYADPTTDSRLRSSTIDLTSVAAAELSFAHAIDIPVGDAAVVRLINTNTNTEIVSGAFPMTVTDANTSSADWLTMGPVSLPVGAPVRIEWCLTGTGDTTDDYMGWYVDDVVVIDVSP